MIYLYTDQYRETLSIANVESDDPTDCLMFATEVNNMRDFLYMTDLIADIRRFGSISEITTELGDLIVLLQAELESTE